MRNNNHTGAYVHKPKGILDDTRSFILHAGAIISYGDDRSAQVQDGKFFDLSSGALFQDIASLCEDWFGYTPYQSVYGNHCRMDVCDSLSSVRLNQYIAEYVSDLALQKERLNAMFTESARASLRTLRISAPEAAKCATTGDGVLKDTPTVALRRGKGGLVVASNPSSGKITFVGIVTTPPLGDPLKPFKDLQKKLASAGPTS